MTSRPTSSRKTGTLRWIILGSAVALATFMVFSGGHGNDWYGESTVLTYVPTSLSDFFNSAYDSAYADATEVKSEPRSDFVLKKWTNKTAGGLSDQDRVLLAKLYRNADSVFEFGLGESTYIAAKVGVPRYAGVDSDPVWVDLARNQSPDRFRFSFADIGATGDWGTPKQLLPKNVLNYQLGPLEKERLPFDVYMVDGRWRSACALLSFLHASSRGAPHDKTKVLIHDYTVDPVDDAGPHKFTMTDKQRNGTRQHYSRLEEVADMVEHSGYSLSVFMRKPETTDEQIYGIWEEVREVVA